MKKTLILLVLLYAVASQSVLAKPGAKIKSLRGDVKVRRGVEETWQAATIGMLLEEIDTILTGEGGEVVLEIHDGGTFKLGSNSILDIGDLRKITEKELFLYLMSKKIGKIEPRKQKTRLRIGNVSVVHGEPKAESYRSTADRAESDWWKLETNGAKALYFQKYYPNAIVKLHKTLAKYSDIKDCGEIYFYLGKSFEAVNKSGQAIDAYQVVIEINKEQGCEDANAKRRFVEAQRAIERLKP